MLVYSVTETVDIASRL